MNPLLEADHQVLKAATALGGTSPTRDAVVYGLAVLLPYLAIGIGLLIFFSGRTAAQRRRNQETIMVAVLALVLSFAARSLIATLVHRPRPYVRFPDIHALDLVSHNNDLLSFPSMHATWLFAFAGVVYFRGKHPRWGVFLVLLSVVVIGARVVAGVHYASDVVAGAALGLLMARLVVWQAAYVDKQLK